MKFYYSTGLEHFKQMLADGALKSDYARAPTRLGAKFDMLFLNDAQRERFQYEFLNMHRNGFDGRRGHDVRLTFEVEATPNRQGGLAIQELSIDHLTEVIYPTRVRGEVRIALSEYGLRPSTYEAKPLTRKKPKNDRRRNQPSNSLRRRATGKDDPKQRLTGFHGV